MLLAQQGACCNWTGVGLLPWPVLLLLVQVLALAYLVYAFHRIARNQMELAKYLKERLEKKD